MPAGWEYPTLAAFALLTLFALEALRPYLAHDARNDADSLDHEPED